jgi:hypothetical protein
MGELPHGWTAQRPFLAEAFRDTEHWGAYMTDLLSEVAVST